MVDYTNCPKLVKDPQFKSMMKEDSSIACDTTLLMEFYWRFELLHVQDILLLEMQMKGLQFDLEEPNDIKALRNAINEARGSIYTVFNKRKKGNGRKYNFVKNAFEQT